jgi:hypothetical protein
LGYDTGVFVTLTLDIFFAFILNVWQLKLFTEERGQLLKGNVHFKGMLALAVSSFPLTWLWFPLANIFAHIAFTLTDATVLVVAELKSREINSGKRDSYDFFTLAPNELAISNEASQLLLDFTSHNFPESV